jgi:hypothetical protein
VPITNSSRPFAALHHEFLEEWHRFQEGARKQKSVLHLNLNKRIKDNVIFVAFAVVEDMHKLHEDMR